MTAKIITKSSGEQVPFDPNKLRRSLERSMADKDVIERVLNDVLNSLYEGMTTKQIYRQAFALLRKSSASSAARYKLKNAIMELGPAGFAFEKFVAEILNNTGYEARTNIILEGKCVKHEVDVIAERGNVRSMIECKFHSDPGKNSDVKIPLYIQSRFNDVQHVWKLDPQHEGKTFEGWVVTNTRFTSDAIQYATCSGLKLISWDYPKGTSLRERIDRSGLHPITSLTTMTKEEKKFHLSQGQVLCSDLCKNPGLMDKYGISKSRKKKILKEAHALCTLNGITH
jgi:Holliday junction resolvase